jgi:hypothetical protein
MELTDGVTSPPQFRLWAGIALVAGALERRVWAKATAQRTFANQYIMLVGAPGVGKQVIDLARGLWVEATEPGTTVKAFRVAPHQMTKAALVDSLAKAKQFKMLNGSGGNMTYHSLLVAAEEFQVLLPNYDQEYIATLNQVYNNPDHPYTEVRRTGTVKELSIELPQLNILAGVQPSYFVSTFPEEAWTTGFARRIVMVYAAETPFKELFEESELPEGLRQQLLRQLSRLSQLHGNCQWEPEAAQLLASWHRGGGVPRPVHSKLVHYCNSRTMLVIKLAIVAALAATGELVIRLQDVKRGLAWLLEAEKLMPDVFREMIGKSDTQVIDELHYMMTVEYSKKRESQPTSVLYNFLRERVPSEKVARVLEVAERSGVIAKVADNLDLWIPRPGRKPGAPE